MLIDVALVIFLIIVIFRGREMGMVRQICSAIGFGIGLFAGALLQPHVINLANTTLTRALLSVVVTLGIGIVFLNIGEFFGMLLKRKLLHIMTLNKVDAILGSIVGIASFVISLWLLQPLILGLPDRDLQQQVSQSAVLHELDNKLPPAPKLLSRIGRLINPNGFPDVFAGLERKPVQTDAPLPDLGELQDAVKSTRASIVKLEGRGCGGTVEGSGFVSAPDTIVTNAHVVAGVTRPTVLDEAGTHQASVIWFDPDLDMAVLKVSGLTGKPLTTSTAKAADGTASVVVGYPGGGPFTAKPASVLDQFTATGHNIYGADTTNRSIYELKADIIPGNSGGPLLDKNGTVIGLIFAQSTSYDQVGYALTMQPVVDGLNHAVARNQVVGTGKCAE